MLASPPPLEANQSKQTYATDFEDLCRRRNERKGEEGGKAELKGRCRKMGKIVKE